jgi:hypothetical protein
MGVLNRRRFGGEQMKRSYTRGLHGLFVVLLALLSSSAVRADEILVANQIAGTVGEYTTLGGNGECRADLGVEPPIWHCGVWLEPRCHERRRARGRLRHAMKRPVGDDY